MKTQAIITKQFYADPTLFPEVKAIIILVTKYGHTHKMHVWIRQFFDLTKKLFRKMNDQPNLCVYVALPNGRKIGAWGSYSKRVKGDAALARQWCDIALIKHECNAAFFLHECGTLNFQGVVWSVSKP